MNILDVVISVAVLSVSLFVGGTENVGASFARPLGPAGIDVVQRLASEDAVTKSVLNVDSHILAAHCNDDVDVDLQVMTNTLLDGESMCGVTGPPATELGGGEQEGQES